MLLFNTRNLLFPDNGPETGSSAVTIYGENFADGATVDFGPNPAASVVVVNATTITCVSPSGSGDVDVTVMNLNGQFGTKALGFTYNP